MARGGRRATVLVATAAVLWIVVFVAPGLRPGHVLQGTDLYGRFSPWNAAEPPGWEAENYLLFDQAVQFFPWRMLTRAMADAGLPPLWNPFADTGSPLAANYQSAVLAPVELLVAGLPWAVAPGVAAAVRLLIAATGMLLLLRRGLGLGPWATLLGILAMIGSGSITILLYHPNSNVSCLLPLVAWLSLRLGQRGRGGDAALLALAMGAQYLGGHPESSLYVGVASTLFTLLGAWSSGRATPEPAAAGPTGRTTLGVAGPARLLGLFAAAQLLGLALGAVQILPFLDYLRDGAAIANREGVRFAADPRAAIGLVAPNLLGTPERPNTYFGPQNYHAVATQYAGLVTLVLGVTGCLAWWRRRDPAATGGTARALGFWLAAAALLALVALLLTYPTPLWQLAGLVPLFRVSANVTGLTLLVAFAVSILGAGGLEALAARRRAPRGTLPVLATATALALVAWALLPLFETRLVAIGAARLAARYARIDHYVPFAEAVARLPLVVAAVRHALLVLGALGAGLTLLVGPGLRRTPALFGALAVVLLVADLMPFGRGYVPAIPIEAAAPWHPALGELHDVAAGRVLPTGRALPANSLTLWGLEDFRGHDAIGSATHRRWFEAMTQAHPLRRTFATYDRDLVDAAGIDWIASEEALEAPGLELDWRAARTGPAGERLHLYRNTAAWPRAFVVPRAADRLAAAALHGGGDADPLTTARAAARRMRRAHDLPAAAELHLSPAAAGTAVAPDLLWSAIERLFGGIERWRRHALAVAEDPQTGTHAAPAPPARAPAAMVSVADLERRFPVAGGPDRRPLGRLVHTPLAVAAHLELEAPGWLVLLDQDLPGWRVTVDGAPAEVGRAWGLFRAVALPPGRHTVLWDYRPASVAWGAATSAVALLVVAGWLALRAAAYRPTRNSDSAGT